MTGEPTVDIAQPDSLAYEAWVIIANAYGGDWSKADPEWRSAATRWRDKFHASF